MSGPTYIPGMLVEVVGHEDLDTGTRGVVCAVDDSSVPLLIFADSDTWWCTLDQVKLVESTSASTCATATGEAIGLSHGKAHLLGGPRVILAGKGWVHVSEPEAPWSRYWRRGETRAHVDRGTVEFEDGLFDAAELRAFAALAEETEP